RSRGSPAASLDRASTPPAEAPTTISERRSPLGGIPEDSTPIAAGWCARPSAARTIRVRLPDLDRAPDGVAAGGRDRDRVAAGAQGAHLDLVGALRALDRAALHALSAARDGHRHLRGLAQREARDARAREPGGADLGLRRRRRLARDVERDRLARRLALLADVLGADVVGAALRRGL